MLRDLISLVYPETCLNCSDTLLYAEDYLCTSCKTALPITNDHLNDQNELLKKFAFEPKIKSATSFLYLTKGGIAQKLLYQLKYNGKKEIGKYLGKMYGATIMKTCFEPDFIVPVPIHQSKLRERGYNQATFFAKGLSNTLGIDVKENLVLRQVKTETQTKKSKVERWENLSNVYSEIVEDLSGCAVLVVDDVITTGATVGMLCERLVEANVGSIHLACIARGQ